MSHAISAAALIQCWCKVRFPDRAARMESTCETIATSLAETSYGSHKYIPVQKLNADLGLPNGAGVYAYHKFTDGSYLLLTCPGPVATWSGADDEAAQMPERIGPVT